MTYDEFSRHLGKAGVSAKEFAVLLKKHPNSVTNNASSGRIPNELGVIAALIGEMAEKNVDFKSVISQLELIKRKSRGAAEVGKFGGNPQLSLKNNKDGYDV
ncbi:MULTISPECIES: XRE family transcriptional regulator [Vibrio]|jgi:hypothetical protein|uniref:XRE family transcriptional regulator n=1 Tax=Vibrio TaxID=662 RepID=UPI0011213735|nr:MULTISPECIES: XRE family transcriptional regulator [Vibrio]MCS0043149.1 hypothetical protein [Vibrio parahaemolyticus]MDA0122904.1 hypothetical protein [Vibrio sp. MM46]TOO80963.1 DNA-binding protein [Vibrio parahaemolyticus]TOQ35633.1 DNA-binding protein [Vibrio parahaemolyticus]HDZ5419707.1 hypothetical protein [Vibrio harveyi]